MPRAIGPVAMTKIFIDSALVAEANAVGVNISRAAEEGIAQAIEKARLWKLENREAIEATNRYVEGHGLPLAKYRQF
jgi:antitoxin CcdA